MRRDIIVQENEFLANYLNKIHQNFLELYNSIDKTETNFTGLSGDVLTTGLVEDSRLSDNIVRKNDVDDLPDFTLIFNNKLI